MMPIVVASVDREGMAVDALSSFTTESVIPAFERIDGVASVSTNGLIEKQYEINIDEARIRQLSDEVRDEIETVLDENRAKLVEAQESLAEGKATLEEESSDQKSTVARSSAQLSDAIAGLNAILGEEALIQAEKAAYEAEKQAMQQLLGLNDLFIMAFPTGISGLTPEVFTATVASLSGVLPADIAALSQAEMAALAEQAAAAPSRIAEIDVQLQNITVREMTITAMKPQLESALDQAMAGYKGLEAGKITMAVELARPRFKSRTAKPISRRASSSLTRLERKP
jgi:HAE1 family hydrophobic/amphiphilic exporter-1